MHNWCTPWKGEEKKDEAKPEAKAEIEGDAEPEEGEAGAAGDKKCDIGE